MNNLTQKTNLKSVNYEQSYGRSCKGLTWILLRAPLTKTRDRSENYAIFGSRRPSFYATKGSFSARKSRDRALELTLF